MGSRKSPILIFINILVFIVLEATALILIEENSIIQKSQIMKTVNGFTCSVSGFGSRFLAFFSMKETNRTLAEENIRLRSENQRLQESLQKAALPDSLISERSPYTYIPARIISNSTDRQHNIIILDKGEKDGIREGMGIITDQGVVGLVQSTSGHYSRVLSFLDTDLAVSAIIKRTHTFGIMRWDGQSAGRTLLRNIPIHTDIGTGDTVITSGYSTIYPPDLPIGVLTDRYTDDGINYSISVRLLEQFQKLEYVYAVINRNRDEMDILTTMKEEEE